MIGARIAGISAQQVPTGATSWDSIPADVLAEVLLRLHPYDVKSIGSIYLTCRYHVLSDLRVQAMLLIRFCTL